jgi:hypothetical protein
MVRYYSHCELVLRASIQSELTPSLFLSSVVKVLLTQYKSSAAFAAIFILYAISAVRFGILLKRHISMYQIDYV